MCGVERLQKRGGYSNLTQHVLRAHQDVALLAHNSNRDSIQTTIDARLIPQRSRTIYGWLDMIVTKLLPFSFCEDRCVRNYVTLETMCPNSLLKSMMALTQLVERKISSRLGSEFSLVLDGWSAASTHYLGVYAVHVNNNCVEKYLIAFSPLSDETNLSAINHHEFISYVLKLFGKSWNNVTCITADNAAVNKAIADVAQCHFVGCASHRYNLAVNDVLQQHDSVIQRVMRLMRKLQDLLPAAKLRRLTPLCAKVMCVTRWSSCLHMLRRYEDLLPYITETAEDDVIDLLPSTREHKQITALVAVLKDLDSVTKVLQSDETTLADVRMLFDKVLEEHPQLSNRLSDDASIVHDVSFERALVKIQKGRAAELSMLEKESVSHLTKKCDDIGIISNDGLLSLAERALKKRRVDCSGIKYVDTSFVLPTSNMVERLFSKAGFAFSDRRQGMTPVHFEALMFLHVNRSLWGPKDITKLG